MGLGLLSFLALLLTALRSITVLEATDRAAFLRCGAVEVYWLTKGPGSAAHQGSTGVRWRWLPKWVEESQLAMGQPNAIRYSPGEFILPLWIPAAFGVLCIYWLLPARGPRHACGKCGYDLKAVPKKDGLCTCPECGTVQENAA